LNLRNLWIHFPTPPPLGVSMRTRSPGSMSQLPFELSSLARAIAANDEGATLFAIRAALQSVRRASPAIGKHRHPRMRKRFYFANCTVAAFAFSTTARLRTNTIGTHAQRVRVFQSSAGVLRLFVMCVCVAFMPSAAGRAPMPPATVS
jgi:hypothetical protein